MFRSTVFLYFTKVVAVFSRILYFFETSTYSHSIFQKYLVIFTIIAAAFHSSNGPFSFIKEQLQSYIVSNFNRPGVAAEINHSYEVCCTLGFRHVIIERWTVRIWRVLRLCEESKCGLDILKVYVYFTGLQSWRNYLAQSKEIQQNWTRLHKCNYLILRVFGQLMSTFSFWNEDWTLGCLSTHTWHLFIDILIFPNFLSLKWFGKSWGNSCTKFVVLDITHRFTCGNSDLS